MIFPGPDYAEAIRLHSPQQNGNCIFGSEIAIGDVNQDGWNDLVVGEYYASVDGFSSAGRAWMFLYEGEVFVNEWSLY